MTRATWRAALFAALSVFAGSASAQETPLGAPQPDKTVRDPEFGVIARHLGLERRVEMLQWQAEASGYARTWSGQPIDSSGFASGHQNPGVLPLQSRRWVAKTVTVEDKPVDPEVIRHLAEWRDFRPSFSALPGNLAATFQPEGDGLGSAENPLAPQIGDLRIRWRDLVLPLLDGKVMLRDGRWQLLLGKPAVDVPVALPEPAPRSVTRRAWPWVIAGLLVLLIGAIGWRRR
jgi:hypothetical protein